MLGVPKKLLSDRETNLLSFLMQDVCHLLGIQKINTTAYHPQTNGMVERFNRTLKTVLRKHVELRGKQWDQHLYAVLHAYRNTPHDTTREKPSYLLFGKDLRTPTEAAYLPETKNRNVESLETYWEKFMTGLTVARQLAAETMLKAQKKYKKYYDRGTELNPVHKTDWVMIKFPHEETGSGRKLSRPWHGPYRAVEVTPTGVVAEKVYEAQDGTIQVHLNRVTKCPPVFPPGYYWYGARRKGPGRPPKWLDSLNGKGDNPSPATESSEGITTEEGSDENPTSESHPPDSHESPDQSESIRLPFFKDTH